MRLPDDDPYVVLHVEPSASQAEITRAFREQVRAHHPDTRAAADNDDALRRVVSAYATLRDATKRAAYERCHPTSNAGTAYTIPVRITVTTTSRPPLWAGPVRRHW